MKKMDYDFLQNYNIPVARQNTDNPYTNTNNTTMEGAYGTYSLQSQDSTPRVNAAYYGYGHSAYVSSQTADTGDYYQNPNRFISPSKHGKGYVPYKMPFKRKNTGTVGGSAAKKETPFPEICSDGKMVMFVGRDESYPDELNQMIHSLSCDLCNAKMNSRIIARDHYESKGHDKHISAWLFKNYTEKGQDPPSIKRFVKQGPTGPDAYHCETCDLKLTSLTHANQHYAGKKHRMVVAQKGKPSGAGFYNSEGKWVRTGTKSTPKYKDNRFGIGEVFQFTELLAKTQSLNDTEAAGESTTATTSAADTTTNPETGDTSKNTLTSTADQDPALFCAICKVSVTSAVQMTMHLSGSKHTKKLKLGGVDAAPVPDNTTEPESTIIPSVSPTDIFTDDNKKFDMYRTPSGQYYCKTCNTSMSNLPGLEQHLLGKRHLKKLTEQKAMATLAAKKM